MRDKKLYIVTHFVQAKTIKEASKLARTRDPDEVYLSQEWRDKEGFIPNEIEGSPVKGFDKNNKKC